MKNFLTTKNKINEQEILSNACFLISIVEVDKIFLYFIRFKGTVSVISRDPSRTNDNARFTTVPLKPLSDRKCGRYSRFSRFKVLSFDYFFIFYCSRNARFTCLEKPQFKIINFQSFKCWYCIHTWSGKGCKGTVVNRAMEGYLKLPLQFL